ncbi:MAG: hypothetical protein ACOYJ6_03660 [Caulobacterales bacterium]
MAETLGLPYGRPKMTAGQRHSRRQKKSWSGGAAALGFTAKRTARRERRAQNCADPLDNHPDRDELAIADKQSSRPHAAKHGVEPQAQHCHECGRKGKIAPSFRRNMARRSIPSD